MRSECRGVPCVPHPLACQDGLLSPNLLHYPLTPGPRWRTGSWGHRLALYCGVEYDDGDHQRHRAGSQSECMVVIVEGVVV